MIFNIVKKFLHIPLIKIVFLEEASKLFGLLVKFFCVCGIGNENFFAFTSEFFFISHGFVFVI